jgi:mitogen-activated protein kinase kinase kinase 4
VNAGHRITSRWAAIPLACLQFLTTDKVVAYLKPESFEKLMSKLNTCLDCIRSPTIKESRSDTSFRKISENSSDKFSPLITSPLSTKKVTVHERIQESIGYLEEDRQNYLEETRKVGRVIETKDGTSEHHFLRSKRAPFEWQRLENKILGAGSFGTCYLVMNLSNNCLMAMKQIKVSRDQSDNLRSLVDEVEIFRQLDHPNLVRYYGIEVHKEELLIFMEYCSEGTLARVCREGLELSCVRRYTHFLLQAVDYLHRKQIVHRDIKPANVFLTQKDILKLGDFGCSFRIRDPTTRVGEIVTYVGTTNYQAPELQTNTLSVAEIASGGSKASGYGRAVDIWAVGCVVLEMLTGKRPYYHLTHELQVVYQLGSGIPPPFTPEITNDPMIFGFLKRCFKVDPKLRATSLELLQDTFANIDATKIDQ